MNFYRITNTIISKHLITNKRLYKMTTISDRSKSTIVKFHKYCASLEEPIEWKDGDLVVKFDTETINKVLEDYTVPKTRILELYIKFLNERYTCSYDKTPVVLGKEYRESLKTTTKPKAKKPKAIVKNEDSISPVSRKPLSDDARRYLLYRYTGKTSVNDVDWKYVLIDKKVSEEFAIEFHEYINNWKSISSEVRLSEATIREFKDYVDWHSISVMQKLSNPFIREFQDRVDWKCVSNGNCQKLTEGFIREFKDRVDWTEISIGQKISEKFIREFKDKVNWEYISVYKSLSEGFIREFKDSVDWNMISRAQKLSEGFIREFKDRVDWNSISIGQKLSEKFIREFQDRVNWEYISEKQDLSEEFIIEFKSKVDWEIVSEYQNISETFIRTHTDLICKKFILKNKNLSKGFKQEFKSERLPRKSNKKN